MNSLADHAASRQRPLAESTGVPIDKKATGVPGFDDITEGGLPAAGVTAIVGHPGSGKTAFALQMLVNGLRLRGERGILVAFEEPTDQIRKNFASFDWGLAGIDDDGICMIGARLPLNTVQTGVFDLSALLASLTALISESGACNIAFDGIDVLLGALNDEFLERQEMIRLGEWVRASAMTALVTVKSYGSGERQARRADIMQYLSDCVVCFEGSLTATAFSRTVRVMKYRGSGFAANPVPFVIGGSGIEVVGFSGTRMSHPTFSDRVSSGVPRLDTMLGGGYIRGSCTLVSGAPGTSKTSLGASFLSAACDRLERSLLVSFDESGSQIISNMRSIGLHLDEHVDNGLLMMGSLVSGGRSPEEHFVAIRKLMAEHQPKFLVIDPLSALVKMQLPFAEMVCERILDQAKSAGITVLCTSLLDTVGGDEELSASHVSTVADTWLHVSYVANQGERNRALTIIKSRGTAHSNQVSEMILGSEGIEIVDVYTAEGEVLMGSARHQKQASDKRDHLQAQIADQRTRFEIDKSVAELKSLLQKAKQDLEWKKREATLLGLDKKAIRDGARTDADERLTFPDGLSTSEERYGANRKMTTSDMPDHADKKPTLEIVATGPSPQLVELKLYIARSTPNSVRAEHNLAEAVKLFGPDVNFDIEIIDVFTNGKRAIRDNVIVTPTLIVKRGDSRQTIIGDLSDIVTLQDMIQG